MNDSAKCFAVSLLLLAIFTAGSSSSERQVPLPPICTQLGDPSTPVGMCFQQLTTSVSESASKSACTGTCRTTLEQFAAQCPGGAALRASLDTICAGIPTPELPTTDDDSGGSGEGGAEGVRATLLSIISATVLAVATTAAFC